MNRALIGNAILCSILGPIAAVHVASAAPRHARQTAEQRHEEIDLLKELDNPISNLIRINIQNAWDFGIGTADAMRYTATLNPVIPFALNDHWSLISRTTVPMIYAEPARAGARTMTSLGDIVQSFYFSPRKTVNRWILGVGPTFLFPSASEHGLGAEQWAVGPTLAVLQQRKGWTYGVLVSQLWSFAGEGSRQPVNATSVAPFVSYITKRMTSFRVSAGSVYDWRARQQTLPVEISTTQVLKIGGQNVGFGLGSRYYAGKATGGPDWGLSFTVSLLFPK